MSKFTTAKIKYGLTEHNKTHTVCVGVCVCVWKGATLGQRNKTERSSGQRRGRWASTQTWILLGIVVLLPALRRPHFLKAWLHLLQDFGGVSNNQLHGALSCFEELHSFLMVLTFHTLEKQPNGRRDRTSRFQQRKWILFWLRKKNIPPRWRREAGLPSSGPRVGQRCLLGWSVRCRWASFAPCHPLCWNQDLLRSWAVLQLEDVNVLRLQQKLPRLPADRERERENRSHTGVMFGDPFAGWPTTMSDKVYLRCSIGPDLRTAVDVHSLIHMFINLGT